VATAGVLPSVLVSRYFLLTRLETLPSGLAVRAEDELTGLPWPVSEMDWTGVVKEDSESVTLKGTIQVRIYGLYHVVMSYAK
jgi:hypothetical protein